MFVIILSGAEALRIEFDRRCSTERRHDPLTVMDSAGRNLTVRSGMTNLPVPFLAQYVAPQSRGNGLEIIIVKFIYGFLEIKKVICCL